MTVLITVVGVLFNMNSRYDVSRDVTKKVHGSVLVSDSKVHGSPSVSDSEVDRSALVSDSKVYGSCSVFDSDDIGDSQKMCESSRVLFSI